MPAKTKNNKDDLTVSTTAVNKSAANDTTSNDMVVSPNPASGYDSAGDMLSPGGTKKRKSMSNQEGNYDKAKKELLVLLSEKAKRSRDERIKVVEEEYKKELEALGDLVDEAKFILKDGKQISQYNKALEDPNKPKKPKSQWDLFMDDEWQKAKQAGDKTDFATKNMEISSKWRGMTEADKKPFADRAAELRKKYEEEMAAWEQQKEEVKID